MLSFLSDRTCTERLKTYRFAKRGHTIQLRLGTRLCRIHGRRMGNVLRMAFTQNRVRSCTGTSLSLAMRLLSSWSALIYYVNARLHGRTRNGKLLVGPVAPNYEYYR